MQREEEQSADLLVVRGISTPRIVFWVAWDRLTEAVMQIYKDIQGYLLK